MRPLKFRVWDKNEMGYIRYPLAWLPMFDNPDGLEIECCGTLAVEQYTGLNDKNDKEIYEGDIVSEELEYGGEKVKTIWQVRWCYDECSFELHYVSGFEVDDCWLVADDKDDYEIIGNIHENPELLKRVCK